MTVLCANCHTANRDRAMFCIGCAGKLPAFAATGPSALDTVGAPLGPTAKPSSGAGAEASAARGGTTAGAAPRGLMLAVLLLGATVLVLAAWISFGPERAAAPGVAAAAAPLQALPATPVAAPAAVAVASPPEQVRPEQVRPEQAPLDSALSPGEAMVPTMPRPASAPITASTPPAAKATAALVSPRPPTTTTTTVARANAGDPRAGCEHLFFVLAARCEAEHCNQAAYARHPRCDVVREQRRRDEARRNLTNGY